LGVYAENGPEYVEDLLEVLGADGAQMVAVPSWHYEEANKRTEMSLREALSKCYDLRCGLQRTSKLQSLQTLKKQTSRLSQSVAAEETWLAEWRPAKGLWLM
jgi:sulfite reductase alpha subunit-like flavoprotein